MLQILAQLKCLCPDMDETPLGIKSPRTVVAFPYVEPDRIAVPPFSFVNARLHQCRTDATPNPCLPRIQPRDLDRSRACDALWWLTFSQSSVTCSFAFDLSNQENGRWISQLARLLVRAECASQVGCHVFRRVVRSKGIGKSFRAYFGEQQIVGGSGNADVNPELMLQVCLRQSERFGARACVKSITTAVETAG